jgi:hypothetical protein
MGGAGVSRRTPLPRAAVALVVLAVAAPCGSALGVVDVVALTERVERGGSISLTARLDVGNATCAVVPRVPAGVARGRKIAAKRSRGSEVTFTWRIGSRAPFGRRNVAVDCGRRGRDRGFYRIVPTRSLEVLGKGFSQTVAPGQIQFVTYGAVVRNPSPKRHASLITVSLNFVDAANRVVSTVAHDIESIPPGQIFNVGGFTTVAGGELVTGVEVVSQVRADSFHVSRLPIPENVRFIRGDGAKVVAVRGEVVNPFTRPIARDARVYAVVFDAAGAVVGGGSGELAADIPSRARAGFDFGSGVDQLSNAGAATVAVSVDPRLTD